MEVVAALQFLKLNQVPKDWVDGAWDLEFADRHPMDDPIEDQLSASRAEDFNTLYQSLLSFAAPLEQSTDTDTPAQNLWAILRENDLSVNSLVAVLSHFILAGKAKNADTEQRIRGLNAAAVYLALLGVPGSVINMVFHEILLDTCADLTRHCWPKDTGGKKRKRDGIMGSQTAGKRPKPQRKKGKTTVEEEVQEEEEEPLLFSSQALKEIRESVVLLVQSLLHFIQTFSLKDRPQRSSFVQLFIKLLYFEPAPSDMKFDTPQDVSELQTVPELAFYGLRLLISPKHGDPERSIQRVFSWILYPCLPMEKGERSRPTLLGTNQAVLSTRDQAIRFVWRLVDEMKDLALPFLQILLQHLCFEMVEKSEYRSHGARAVGMLTAPMEAPDYAQFVRWLLDLSRGKKMLGRLFSADVALVLLEQPERNPEDCEDLDLAYFLPHQFLVQNVLFDRTQDVSPTVQSHVLTCLAQCLELRSLNATRAMHRLFNTTESHTVLEAQTPGEIAISHKTPMPRCTSTPFRTVCISSPFACQCNAKENVALILQRVSDVKVSVRKAALQTLLGLLKHDVIPSTLENVTALAERSRDLAVSVRKKTLQSIAELLSLKRDSVAVQTSFLDSVLQAVMDDEDQVQDKALDLLDQVLLVQVRPYRSGLSLDPGQRLAWDLLGLLEGQCKHLSKHFTRVFTLWTRQNKFTVKFISDLTSHLDAPHAQGAWLMLSKVAWTSPRLHYGKILEAWNAVDSSPAASSQTYCHIMRVLGNISKHMDKKTKDTIIADVMSRLKTFSLPLDVISGAVQLLYRLGPERNPDIKKTQAFLNKHCGELVSLSEAHLASILLQKQGTQNLNVDLMIKHLHTLGVASLRCPAKINKRTILVVESVLASPSESESPEELPESLALSQFQPNPLPTKVRAAGVLALGKLCLQHEDLARKYLPVFARELEVGVEPAVRRNVVMTMCDLCVRYTNLVDYYIPNVSACLRDGDAGVREQALKSLTHLLREEYIKWRGSLFFRFTVLLVDSIPSISSLCAVVLRMVLKRNPEMFSQHFVECVFFLNAYNKHRTYNHFPQTQREQLRFSLKGADQREKRFRIYRFLLEHFTDAQRFNVSMRLNNTVLACFADRELPVDSEGAVILSDVFQILSLKEMRLQVVTSGEEEVEEEELTSSSSTSSRAVSSTSTRAPDISRATNSSRASLASAQKRVVLQVHKKAFVENTVPLILSLKRLLEKKLSPALGDLYTFLQEKMKDYRSEMKEVLKEDEQLAAELEYTLSMADRDKVARDKTMEDSLSFSIIPRDKTRKSPKV